MPPGHRPTRAGQLSFKGLVFTSQFTTHRLYKLNAVRQSPDRTPKKTIRVDDEMNLSENEGIEDNVFVVTGGLGFVGAALCDELIRRGARQVRAFDIRSSSQFSDRLIANGVCIVHGDVVSKEDVDRALRGVDCVFHLASFGMSGKEMMQFKRVDDVNINGTCQILDACNELGVRRLVYVSTYNVVFGGKEIVNGNEGLPYFPIDKHVDSYGRSKSVAEQLVLKMNGRPSKIIGKSLYTCAIRPAAIYGPGEERHFPRILSLAKLGLLPFKIGGDNVESDWLYVDNLVLALIKASMGLLDDIPGKGKKPIAAGQPYFICDGHPVNTFEFLCPLLKSLDYDIPTRSISVGSALLMGKFVAAFYTLLHPWLKQSWLPQPLLLPTEVYKVGVTHYFSYLKAKEELGYTPVVSSKDGMSATISYYKEKKRKELDGPTLRTWLIVVFGMFAFFAGGYLPNVGPVKPIRALALLIFRSLFLAKLGFIVAVAIHFVEATYAWTLAKKVDPRNAKGWFWQTLVLGFFSMRFLLKRSRTV